MNHPNFLEHARKADAIEVNHNFVFGIHIEDGDDVIDPYITIVETNNGIIDGDRTYLWDAKTLNAMYYDEEETCWISPDDDKIRLFTVREQVPA